VRQFKSSFAILPPLRNLKRIALRAIGRGPPAESLPPAGTYQSGMIRPNSPGASLIYVLYYALDHFLGRLRMRRLRGQCGLLIFDRYFYDYYYQIGNRRTPRWFLQLCETLVPTPDLLVLLDRDPDQIFAAKPELAVAEIRLQQALIVRLFHGRPQARIVDGRAGLEPTVELVRRLVIASLRGKSGAAA
jgi:hypothetical protein